MLSTSTANRWLNRFYKILAVLLVIVAVMISAFRLLLPHVHHYRQTLENFVNKTYQTNVIIGDLSMNWQQWGPALVASKLTLVDNKETKLTIEYIEIHLNFLQSLIQQDLVADSLILDGVVLELDQNVFFNTGETDSDFQEITGLIFKRINYFSLKNSQVLINSALINTFKIDDLHWFNSGERHQAQGNLIVNKLSSNNLTFKIDIVGDVFDELKGSMYLEANHLDIAPWLDSFVVLDNASASSKVVSDKKTKDDISFSSWFSIEKGLLEKVHVELHDNKINWQTNGENQYLSSGAGQLLLTKNEKPTSFELYSTPLTVQFNQQPVQEFVIQVNNSPTGISAYVSSFNLPLVTQLSSLFVSDEVTRQLLTNMDAHGQVSDLYFTSTVNSTIESSGEGIIRNNKVVASFTDVSTKFSQGIPGIEHVSGQLSLIDNNLHVALVAQQGALDFNQHFIAPIKYDSLAATIDFNIAEQGWLLDVNELDFNSQEIALTADLLVEKPFNGETHMSLLATITRGDASKVGHYLPLSVMSSGLVEYLNDAIVDGEVKQAQVLLNGPLANFPYTDNSGVFIVDAELEQATFKFGNEWPAIKDFSANLNFTNNSMLITARKGKLVDLNVTGVQVAIDDLAEQKTLTVDALIQPSPASYIAALMQQSPLKNSVGSALAKLQTTGDITGEFHLKLPLKDIENSVASGLLNFADNKVVLQQPRMSFTQVNGRLSFTNDKILTENLTLSWQGLPLKLDITASNKTNYYTTDIKLGANWSKKQWQQHLPTNLKKYFAGNLQWQGGLSLFQHHNDDFSYRLNVNSNLQQAELKLPIPYNKKTGQNLPLKINVSGDLTKSTINASYGKSLSFSGILEHDANQFSRAHLMLGQEKVLLPETGFHITSKLGSTNVDEWQPFVSDIIEATSSNTNDNQGSKKSAAILSKPESIKGTLASLDIYGQRLTNVSFNFLDKTDWWLLQLNAKEISSEIKFYPDLIKQGIDINAEFIKVSTGISKREIIKGVEDDSLKALVNELNTFTNMPRIKMHCDSCKIDKLDLGMIDFLLTRTSKDSIKLEYFTAKRSIAKKSIAEFDFSGQWQQKANKTYTNVSGYLSLDDIEQELKLLGFASLIRDSGGKVDFNLNWLGGPHEFSFDQLNGDVKAKVDDGYLAEVSDKARVFSVLSLESIVRKMTLDFRDMFSDGMFYKKITGDYHIKEGVLYTDNTYMNGAAGKMYIKGSTSFVSNKLDYHITYKPNLTSSLPVLAWAATLNPVVFIAGLAIDQVITSQVVSEFDFELTGTMNDPIFKEVSRKSRDVSVGRSQPPEFIDAHDD